MDHMYTWDPDKNVVFPANVQANTFNGHVFNAAVNSGTSSAIAYYSGANAISSYSRMRILASNRYVFDLSLNKDSSGARVGEFWYDTGDNTNVTTGRWYWRQWSPKATPDTGVTSYYETY
jgi:hypothetical protein